MRIEFMTSYEQDIRLLRHGGITFWYGLLLATLLAFPWIAGKFYVGELTQVLIYAVAGLGLMVLTGFTGQVSLGHAAFLALGAYAQAALVGSGWPVAGAMAAACAIGALVGAAVALPASRMSGIYLAVATLVFGILVEDVAGRWVSVTGGNHGRSVPDATLLGMSIGDPRAFYYLVLAVTIAAVLVVLNVLRSSLGRAFFAMRDSELGARSMGIHTARAKVQAFALSAGITAVAGALFAHHLRFLTPEIFGTVMSTQLLLLIVVGGIGTVHGAFFGALALGLLQNGLSILKDVLPPSIGEQPGLEPGLFGLVLMATIVFEPAGLYGQWAKLRTFLEVFPLYRARTFQRQRSYLTTERMR